MRNFSSFFRNFCWTIFDGNKFDKKGILFGFDFASHRTNISVHNFTLSLRHKAIVDTFNRSAVAVVLPAVPSGEAVAFEDFLGAAHVVGDVIVEQF